MKKTEYKVEMSSTPYGVEEFIYDTPNEAVTGFDRLILKCREYNKIDGITRELRLFKGDTEQMCHIVYLSVDELVEKVQKDAEKGIF